MTPRVYGPRIGAWNDAGTWGRNGDLIANGAGQQHCRQPGRRSAARLAPLLCPQVHGSHAPNGRHVGASAVNRSDAMGYRAPVPLMPKGNRAKSPEATRMQ